RYADPIVGSARQVHDHTLVCMDPLEYQDVIVDVEEADATATQRDVLPTGGEQGPIDVHEIELDAVVGFLSVNHRPRHGRARMLTGGAHRPDLVPHEQGRNPGHGRQGGGGHELPSSASDDSADAGGVVGVELVLGVAPGGPGHLGV